MDPEPPARHTTGWPPAQSGSRSLSFTHQAWPGRVVFGSGTLDRVPDECERLGASRALVLCTPGRREPVDRLARALGRRYAGRFDKAAMHTPVEVTEEALGSVADLRADVLIAVGGGSTTGLAKALALRTDLPQVIVPTTYAGSEVTPVLGETRDGRKTTTADPRILPETVVYDVELTLALPHECHPHECGQRHGPCGRVALRTRALAGDPPARGGVAEVAAVRGRGCAGASRRPGFAQCSALRRVARRKLPGHHVDGPAAQAGSRPRRQLRPPSRSHALASCFLMSSRSTSPRRPRPLRRPPRRSVSRTRRRGCRHSSPAGAARPRSPPWGWRPSASRRWSPPPWSSPTRTPVR